jgi:UDP-glucose 4-epimerase
MKIVITGASGYLGGRLISHLAQDASHEIIAASRQSLAVESPIKSHHINWLDNDSILNLCKETDVIIHLASKNERESEADYQSALLENGLSSLKLMEAAETNSVRRFIYMSSIKVFGSQHSGLLDENTPAHPQSSYGITHKLVEDYLLAKHLKGTIEGVVLRLSNAVGAPNNLSDNLWSLIGNDFCRQAATIGEITLNSSGDTWRNFIAIKDIEKAFDTLLTAPANSLQEGVFNLGSSQPMRIIDLARLIAERAELLWNKKINLKHPQAISFAEPPTLNWKIDKLCNLGWQPGENTLVEEIDNTLRFCNQHFGP